MVWFKVDDTLAFHEKTVAAGNPAMGLWVRAGSWCAQMLTDGFIPDHMIAAIGTKAQAKALTEVGLWAREESGYRFHGWLDYNPTAEEVRADQARKHEAKVAAGRAGGLASGVARRKHKGSRDEADAKQSRSETKPRPVPSRPVPFSGDIEGGGTSVDAHEPPLDIPSRCADHQYDVTPPKCGACADARVFDKSNRERLAAAPESLPDYRVLSIPELCGNCDDRWIETPTGLARCPECGPKQMRKSA